MEKYIICDSESSLPEDLDREELVKQSPPPEYWGKADGYRGIWFILGQYADNPYGDKYSGGLGTYTAQHIPLAVYASEVNKTFFVYGGTTVKDETYLLIMASYYDHDKHLVPRPTIVHDKQGIEDPHENPVISIDSQGYIWVFVSGRGRGRPGYKYRSTEPYSVEEFELITPQEICYPQLLYIPESGFMHLFTKYTGNRELYWETSSDGIHWSDDKKLAGIKGPGQDRSGHYQVTASHNGKVVTAFNWHDNGRPDNRTNLYVVQTEDMGETWTTVDGLQIQTPLVHVDNPALVIDYHSKGMRVYLNDINFDKHGNPIIQYVISKGPEPGPANDPRIWRIAHWDGQAWKTYDVCHSDHNYDAGSLYVDGDKWIIIGPTEVGPQDYHTGGEMAVWASEDSGQTWSMKQQITHDSQFNHKYARRPLNAKDPFFVFWADGDPSKLSESRLYFSNSTGDRYWMLPYTMDDDYAEPIEMP